MDIYEALLLKAQKLITKEEFELYCQSIKFG